MKRRKGRKMEQRICRGCGESYSIAAFRREQKYCSRRCLYEAQVVPPMERLRFHIDECGCHVWDGARCDGGYAMMTIRNVATRVHVVVYEHHHGPVPDGMEIDHQCRNRACINERHLEAVPHKVNVARGERWYKNDALPISAEDAQAML